MTEATDRIEDALSRRFRPYAEYRDSGVDWLGEVPAHWEPARLWRLCSATSGATPTKENPAYWNGEVPWVSPKDMKRRVIATSEDLITQQALDETGIKLVTPPVVLVVVRGMILAHSFPVAVTAAPVTINQDMKALRLIDAVDVFYFAWALDGLARGIVATVVEEAAHGTRVIRMDQWRSLVVPLPPHPEQQAIAAFLDRETAKIDALVARKERLIELLQEKRTALITRAVTRGLDPNVPMKDSGVEWLGKIPAHWEVRPLKSTCGLQTGLTLGKRYKGEAMTTRPYLRVANVQDGYLALDDIAEVDVPVRDVRRYELRAGDVLMTEGGDFDKFGRGHVWEAQLAQCLHQNHIFAVRPRRSALTSEFLALAMSCAYGRAYFTATSKQSTNLASTNSTKLRNFPIPLPGLDDQVEITRWANRESTGIDALVIRIREAIGHLREFRTSLISAAVTGKIDVREAREAMS